MFPHIGGYYMCLLKEDKWLGCQDNCLENETVARVFIDLSIKYVFCGLLEEDVEDTKVRCCRWNLSFFELNKVVYGVLDGL